MIVALSRDRRRSTRSTRRSPARRRRGGAGGRGRTDARRRLLVGRSTVVDVGTPIARVSLTSADVADALVTSPNELLVNGKMPGTISMFVWDRAGAIRRYEVIVQRDLARLTEQMKQLFPGEAIEVAEQRQERRAVRARSPPRTSSRRPSNVAAGYVDKKEEVVTLLQVQDGAPSNQVLLRVRFAEVQPQRDDRARRVALHQPDGIKNTSAGRRRSSFARRLRDLQCRSQQQLGSDVTSATARSRSATS